MLNGLIIFFFSLIIIRHVIVNTCKPEVGFCIRKANVYFIIKINYSLQIVIYSLFAGIVSILLIPFVYVKLVINSIIILIKQPNQFMYSNLINCVIAIFFGVPLLLLPLIIDFIIMPNLLMRDEELLEAKY